MKLDVPLVIQPKDSLDCGIASTLMLLKYYGKKESLEGLKEGIQVHENGTYAPQIGSFLIRQGFEVTIITMHPKLFTLKDRQLANTQLLERFKTLLASATTERDKLVLNYFIKFIDDGGKMIVKIPGIEDIKREIDNGRPVGALMTTNFLNGAVPKFNFHSNIITGYDDRYIYANDPLWDERGGKVKYTYEEFLYGLYASAYGDVDNACLVLIKRR